MADEARHVAFGVLSLQELYQQLSHAEIREVMRAGNWQEFAAGEQLVREGDMDDRFYVIVSGECEVERAGGRIGTLGAGDCFGEAIYVPGAKRFATVRAVSPVTVMTVGSTLLEQASIACQLRFNKMFLSTLISRLQASSDRQSSAR